MEDFERQDAAAGSVDELVLTGARAWELLLGKWLGVSAAGVLWALALAPVLVLVHLAIALVILGLMIAIFILAGPAPIAGSDRGFARYFAYRQMAHSLESHGGGGGE